jgi:hypothetical protein
VISETKTVQDFLSGITNPSYDTAKTLVCGDKTKLGSFEACQQLLKTVAQLVKLKHRPPTNAKRGVLAFGTNRNKSKGGGKTCEREGLKGRNQQIPTLRTLLQRRVQGFKQKAAGEIETALQ